MVHSAVSAQQTIYQPGYRYAKAGVSLMDLHQAGERQADFFGMAPEKDERRFRLMQMLDTINQRFGSSACQPGVAGIRQRQIWQMQRGNAVATVYHFMGCTPCCNGEVEQSRTAGFNAWVHVVFTGASDDGLATFRASEKHLKIIGVCMFRIIT